MDPNLSKLDPKLREAYERVMNGPSPTPQGQTTPPNPNGAPPPPAAPAQTPGSAPVHSPQPSVTPPPPMPPMGRPPLGNQTPPPPPSTQSTGPALDPTPAINSTIAFNAHDSGMNKGTTDVKKGKSGIVKILMLALVIIAFLAVYTVVWVYLFHLKLPFIG